MCGETGADYLSDGGGVAFAPKLTRAKKAHRCHDCSKEIQPGHLYVKRAGTYEGDFWTATLCASCERKARWLNANGHAWVIGLIAKDYEYCRFGDHTKEPEIEP